MMTIASLPQGGKVLRLGGVECKNRLPIVFVVCKTNMDGSLNWRCPLINYGV